MKKKRCLNVNIRGRTVRTFIIRLNKTEREKDRLYLFRLILRFNKKCNTISPLTVCRLLKLTKQNTAYLLR